MLTVKMKRIGKQWSQWFDSADDMPLYQLPEEFNVFGNLYYLLIKNGWADDRWLKASADKGKVYLGLREGPDTCCCYNFDVSELPNDLITPDDLKLLGIDLVDRPAGSSDV